MKRTPLYSQIREYVFGRIRERHWRANDRLPTEAELAEQFGVSRFTVKKALGELAEEGLIFRIQGKGSYVSPDTAFAQGGWTLPPAGASPAAGPVLRPVLLLTPHLQSSLSAQIAAGAEEVLSAHGCDLILRSSHNKPENERRALSEAVRAGVHGILIFPVDGEAYNEDALRLALNKFPVVVIDRYLKGVDTNCVCSDHFGGASDAVAHLIGLGHERIGFVSVHGKPTTSLRDRQLGFEQTLARHRLSRGETLTVYEREDKDAAQAIRSFLERLPRMTAIVAATFHSGTMVLETAAALGLRVPEQLSVVFFDDAEYASLHRVPPTCVVQQERQLGVEAAKLLLSVMDDPLQERRRVTLPTRLAVRGSSSPPNRPAP